ncbi:MAG: uao [Pseudonocardiales bacterium]|nr:uao [Pseudonocardiales bacterium]
MTTSLGEFNDADADDLTARLLALTAAPEWAAKVVDGRPYSGVDDVLTRSEQIFADVPAEQIDAALAGHPRIGEKAAHLDAESAQRSAGEQAGMNSADAAQKQALAQANADYEARFGRIYLVAAAGLSADELLAKAQARLANDPITELAVVRDELARITQLRLTSLLTSEVTG